MHLLFAKLRCRCITDFFLTYGCFDVGTVITPVTHNNRILTAVGKHHELFAARSAYRAGVRFDHTELKSKTSEYLFVGLLHQIELTLHIRFIGMEAVAVFHQELTSAHQPETGSDLIAEFEVDLVEIERQLLIALDALAHEVDHHLFMGGTEYKRILFAVFKTQQFLAVLLIASALFPE